MPSQCINSICKFDKHAYKFLLIQHRFYVVREDSEEVGGIQEVCNHDEIQAEQCATLVHYKGKCVVKNGGLKEITIMGEILAEAGLTVEIN